MNYNNEDDNHFLKPEEEVWTNNNSYIDSTLYTRSTIIK